MMEEREKLKKLCQRVRVDFNKMLELIEYEMERADRANASWEPLTDRQHWILDQLRRDVKLTRAMVEKEFEIGEKQAKRALTILTNQGMTKFIRSPRPGYYILITKKGNQAAAAAGQTEVGRAPAFHDSDLPTIIPFSRLTL